MTRWMTLTLALGAALAFAVMGATQPVLAQDGHGGESGGVDAAALRGAAVFAEFCQACHGSQGEALGTGLAFPPIAKTLPGAQVRAAIVEGAGSDTGTAMPAYSEVLSATQIDDLLAYIGTWTTGDVPPLPEPNIGQVAERVAGLAGHPPEGAVVYARFCAGCHGVEGAGRDAPAFPRLEGEPAQIVHTARVGHDSPYMPAFSVEQGGPLSEEQLTDLEAYLATWTEHAAAQPKDDSRGYSLLIVVAGVIAVLLVGAIYMARLVVKEEA